MATRAASQGWTSATQTVRASVGFAAASAFWAVSSVSAAPATKPPDTGAREWPYRIVPGDTLIGLAAAYLQKPADWQGLQRHNKLPEPRRLVPGSTLRIPFEWLKREAAVADVVFVQGRVALKREGSEPGPLVQPGLRVLPGDSLRTGAQSSVSLRFADGSRLLIVPDSEVTMEQLLVYGRSGITDTRLRIDRGGADTQVVPNAAHVPAFEVRTPAVNLGVRGTDFRVGVDASGRAARVEVLAGSVGAGRDGPGTGSNSASNAATAPAVLVDAGFGTRADDSGPVAPPRPLLPAPGVAAGLQRFERLPPTLNWAPVPGASRYRAQIFVDGQAGSLLRDGQFTDTQALWPADEALPDGRYLLRVRALDADGIEGLDGSSRFVLAARPLPPAAELPYPGAVRAGEVVNLRWELAPGVMRYRLQLADSDDFSQPLRDQPVVGNDTSLTLLPGVYHWRVAGVSAAEVAAKGKAGSSGPFGESNAFDLRAVPALPTFEPTQFSPANLLLRWKTTAPGQGVQVQLAHDEGFEQRLVDQRTWASQLQVARPAAGTYHLRLRSVLGDEPVGEFGPAQVLVVPGVPWWERLWLGR